MTTITNRARNKSLSQKLINALIDVVSALNQWRPWYTLGNSELKQRYRRSVIGPFWITLTLGTQVFVMGYLLSILFNQEVNKFLPFICISLILWGYFSSSINEGCSVFISMGGIIGQVKRPFSTYIMLILWRNAIIFLHTVVIFFIIAIIFKIYPSKTYLLIPCGLLLLVLNVGWMVLLLATVSARFHDIPPLIQNFMTVLVWLTPIYYNPSQVSGKLQVVIALNPLASIIEVARAPFLNIAPEISSWIVASSVALIGWMLSIIVFALLRARISLWV